MLKGRGNENIYPVTASDLVYDPITKKNVKEELGDKVEEAPKNDKQYARVNGTWAEVEAGAVSEIVLITLTPAVAELNGVTVKVTTNEGETLLDTTWEGAQLSVQVRAGLEYTVSVGDKDGFIAPQAVTYTAVKGATRSINMAYIESRLKVNILSNQGEDSAISVVKATVKYGSTSVQVANGGMVSIPLNVDVTITFPDVEGYKKPETISYTHTSGSYEKSGTYQTEIVSVTLSADNNQSVSGQIVTINGTQHTWDGTAIIQKVAFGIEYTVSVNDKDGYEKPADRTFIANQASRELALVYTETVFGAFIQDIYGRLYTEEEWDGTQKANGIAILLKESSFVVSLSELENMWASANSILAEGVLATSDAETALYDFNGFSNTQKINEQYPSQYGAAKSCYNFIFPNGQSGFLPALGQLRAIHALFSEVQTLILMLGETELNKSGYWSSTQYDYGYKWVLFFTGNNTIDVDYRINDDPFKVRPCAPYIANPNIIKFYILGEEFECLEGSTWEQWCKSAFNIKGYKINGNNIDTPNEKYTLEYDNGNIVNINDAIIPNHYYNAG